MLASKKYVLFGQKTTLLLLTKSVFHLHVGILQEANIGSVQCPKENENVKSCVHC